MRWWRSAGRGEDPLDTDLLSPHERLERGQDCCADCRTAADIQRSFLIGVTSAAGNLVDIGASVDVLATQPTAINAYGQVVAATTLGSSQGHAYLWSPGARNATSGAWTDLGTLSGDDVSLPFGINDSGRIVGFSTGPQGARGFIWTPDAPNGTTGTMVALADGLAIGLGINNAGQIVGVIADPSTGQPLAALWTPDGNVVNIVSHKDD